MKKYLFTTFLVLASAFTMVISHPAVSFADCASDPANETGDCPPAAATTPAATTPAATTPPGVVPTSSSIPNTPTPVGQTTLINGQPSYTLLEPLPCLSGTKNSNTVCTTVDGVREVTAINIQGYILYLFKIAIAIAVLLAVVMVTWGGFKYMTVESVTGKSDAKETIQNAILGMLGALGSYLILYTINPQLVDLNLVAVPKLNITINANNLGTANLNTYINTINGQISAATIQQNALDKQAQTDQTQVNNLQDQFNQAGCNTEDPPTPNQCASMQTALNNAQATAAASTAASATGRVMSSYALNDTNVTSPNTTVNQVNDLIADNQKNAATAIAALPNNDATDKQTINNNLTLNDTLLQNQALLLNYQNGQYFNSTESNSAKNAAIGAIQLNTAKAEVNLAPNDPLRQQYAANQTVQINQINGIAPQQTLTGALTGQK